MSAVASLIESPVRHEYDGQLEYDIVLELATADDLGSAGDRLVEWIRYASGAARVEWWATRDDGALELVAATGPAFGRHHELPLGHSGLLVLHGGRLEPQTESVLASLLPILRRRAADERLLRTTIELARRNEALEEYAALVAHELKTPLRAALVADDPLSPVEDALDLVEGLLEAARNEPGEDVLLCGGDPRRSRQGSRCRARDHQRPGHDAAASAGAAPSDPAKPALERR